MGYAITISTTGSPDVMHFTEQTALKLKEGEVRLKQTAIGVNYIDTYHRSGLYPVELPCTLGIEAAGTIKEVGLGVTGLKPGDRVAYATAGLGAYAEERVVPAEKLIALPANVSDETAAAVFLKGMTAEYLLQRTYAVAKGQTILLHAAAGGVGLIACQWAKRLGCTVIGTVGSPAKAELAKANGCDHVILYREESVSERVLEITKGRGVPVVYDGVGQATFKESLASLGLRGLLVSYGQASGVISQFDPKDLAAKSLYYTRPSLFNYAGTREELEQSSARVIEALTSKRLRITIGKKYALKEAAQAHLDLEARKLIGSTLLIP